MLTFLLEVRGLSFPPAFAIYDWWLHIAGGLLSILMVIFEICSAGITIIRAIQALLVSGPWKAQKRGFMYLLLEQGMFQPPVLG